MVFSWKPVGVAWWGQHCSNDREPGLEALEWTRSPGEHLRGEGKRTVHRTLNSHADLGEKGEPAKRLRTRAEKDGRTSSLLANAVLCHFSCRSAFMCCV